MTREISEYAELSGDFAYHITSLNPLNPENAADDFEKTSLALFEKGTQEKFSLIKEDSKLIYRYIAPLYVEKKCLQCHAKQGYKEGDVRGGISVTFDVTDIKNQMALNRNILIGLNIAFSLILLGIIFLLTSKAARKLSKAYSMIEKLSIKDELTQLYNRRYFYTRLDEEISRADRYGNQISIVMIDIDHFKQVNDVYGHQAGDSVLKDIAYIVKSNSRKVNIAARYGGEEFVVILQETDKNHACLFAEKIRKLIENHGTDISSGKTIKVTASFGVSSLGMINKDIIEKSRQIIKLADDALYKAKKSGRNQVAVFSDHGSQGSYNQTI